MPDTNTAVATPNDQAALLADPGDEPLIPREEPSAQEVTPQAQPEVTPALTGAKPEAEAPTPEVQPEAVKPPEQPKTPPPGYVSEENFRRLQSVNDRRIAEMEKRLNEREAAAQQREQEALANGYRQAYAERLKRMGVDEVTADREADDALGTFRAKQQLERELQEIKPQISQRDQQIAQLTNALGKYGLTSWVDHLSSQHQLSREDRAALVAHLDAAPSPVTDPQGYERFGASLEGFAQSLARKGKEAAQAKKAQLQVVPAGQKFESNGSGGAMTAAQELDAMNNDRIPFNPKRAEELLRQLGQW